MANASEPDQGLGRMGSVLVADADLFFSVKVADTLRRAGYTVKASRTLEALEETLRVSPPDLICISLAERGMNWQRGIEAARTANVPVLAYGAHVDSESHALARTLGATSVVAHSKLNADLPALVQKTLRRAELRRVAREATENTGATMPVRDRNQE